MMSTPNPPAVGALRLNRRSLLAGSVAAAAVGALPSLSALPAQAETRPTPDPGYVPGEGQPYALYWFPDRFPPTQKPDPGAHWRSLLDWDPATDPDVVFNTSTVPLARRVTPAPGHRGQHLDETRVMSLVSFGPTSRYPSQGGWTSNFYAFTNWQYVDELVFWGGSTGEGLILAPTAPVVDAAHRAGVPVLGNVFLAPQAWGGVKDFTHDLVREVDGRFPVADKLIEVAQLLGFDGWFINAETDIADDPEHPTESDLRTGNAMKRFVQYLEHNSDLRIVWYDALLTTGVVSWKNRLCPDNAMFLQDGQIRSSDEIFLNFWWTDRPERVAETQATARAIGRSVHDAFFGIDTEAKGYATPVSWDLVWDPSTTQPYKGSLGLYRPEWTRNHLGADFTLEDFQVEDHKYWVGMTGRPHRRDTAETWPGVAAYVPERTTITDLPFTTTFNTGAGRGWWIEGCQVSTAEWNHLGVQDVQPTRRWITRGHDLAPRYDYSTAYNGASCLALDLAGRAGEVDLFWTAGLQVPRSTVLELFVDGAGDFQVVLGLSDGTQQVVPAPARGRRGGWTRYRAKLSSAAGSRIVRIGLRAKGRGTVHLGQVHLAAHTSAPAVAVKGLRARASGEGVRLTWRRDRKAHHYEVWADGVFAGVSSSPAWYLPRRAAVVEVVAVGADAVRAHPVRARVV